MVGTKAAGHHPPRNKIKKNHVLKLVGIYKKETNRPEQEAGDNKRKKQYPLPENIVVLSKSSPVKANYHIPNQDKENVD